MEHLYAYLDTPNPQGTGDIIKPDYEREATIGDLDTRERPKPEAKEDFIALSFI